MKLKTLKPHYHDGLYRVVSSVYMADKMHGESAVRNGLCEEIEKKPVKEDKKRKLKLEKK